MKKLLCAFLALALLAIPALTLPVGAANGGGFLYEIYAGEAYVTGYTGSDARVTVPASLGGAPVTRITGGAFGGRNDITAVVLPDTLKHIEQYAFTNCTSLTEVQLPEGLLSIGTAAFGGCPSLQSVRIPASVSEIGLATLGSSGVKRLTVAEGNPYLYSEGNCIIERSTKTLLQGCSTSVIPQGVKVIRNSAFSGTGLTEVTIPDSVTTIEANAFWGESDLTDATIGNGVRFIGDEAFLGCRKLTSIRIPASVTTMGNNVFDLCGGLTDIFCDRPFPSGNWNENWLGNCYATVHWADGILGDVSGDGEIEATDYLLLKRYCLGTFRLNDAQKAVADATKDGEINALDYMMVKRHVLGTFKIG